MHRRSKDRMDAEKWVSHVEHAKKNWHQLREISGVEFVCFLFFSSSLMFLSR